MALLRWNGKGAIRVLPLMVGIAAMGWSGCGGEDSNDSTDMPPLAAPALGVVRADQTVAATLGQQAFVETSALNPDTTGGIARVSVVIPQGSLLQSGNLSAAVIPRSASTIERILRATPGAVERITSVAEIVFGFVDASGNITSATRSLSTGTGDAPVYQIQLSPARSDEIDILLGSTSTVYEWRVLKRDENNFTDRLIEARDCRVTYNSATDLITVENCRGHGLNVVLLQKQP